MPHSLTRIWLHIVWGTKDRYPYMAGETKYKIIKHLEQKFTDLESQVRIIDGTEDHLHSLILFHQNRSLNEVMKNVKGESSHWINQNGFFKTHFSWQIGYGAFSVSESQIKEVKHYIKNQVEHHKSISFKDEWELLLQKHNIVIFNK